jgi:hypothetical protein
LQCVTLIRPLDHPRTCCGVCLLFAQKPKSADQNSINQ